jgi:hypothetical protein
MSRSFASLLSCLPIGACVLIASVLIGSNPALSAQRDPFWAFLPEGRVVPRCVEGSAAQKEASAALQRLDERIRGLADSAPAANAVGELHACWLIIAGRRGHHEFCQTVRAYDLVTGAAFIDDNCSEITHKWDGRIESDMYQRGMVRRIKAGAVPVENLRETLWMLLLRSETEEVQVDIEYYPVPEGVKPQAVVRRRTDEYFGGIGGWSNTAQTRLTWRWIPAAGPVFVGNFTWPEANDAAENHAAALLDVAEEGFVERCPPRSIPSLPTLSRLASRRTHNLNEIEREDIYDLDGDLRDAVERWKPLRSCSSSR